MAVNFTELNDKFNVPHKRLAACLNWLYGAGLIDRKLMDEDDERQDDENGGKRDGTLYISLTYPPYKILHEYDYEAFPQEREYKIFNFSLRKEHLATYLRLKDWKEKHPGQDCPSEVLDSFKAGLKMADGTKSDANQQTVS